MLSNFNLTNIFPFPQPAEPARGPGGAVSVEQRGGPLHQWPRPRQRVILLLLLAPRHPPSLPHLRLLLPLLILLIVGNENLRSIKIKLVSLLHSF